MGLFDFLRSAPSKQASVETGGLRDLYMKHMEEAAVMGVQPLPFPEFVKRIQEQQSQQQMQQRQMLEEQMKQKRGLLSPN